MTEQTGTATTTETIQTDTQTPVETPEKEVVQEIPETLSMKPEDNTKETKPEEDGDYTWEYREGETDNEIVAEFMQLGKEMGLTKEQLKKFNEFDNAKAAELIKKAEEKRSQQTTEWIDGLKKEWGGDFENNVKKARNFTERVVESAMPGTMKYFEETGLGNNPFIVKMMLTMSNAIAEDSLGEGKGAPTTSGPREIPEKFTFKD